MQERTEKYSVKRLKVNCNQHIVFLKSDAQMQSLTSLGGSIFSNIEFDEINQIFNNIRHNCLNGSIIDFVFYISVHFSHCQKFYVMFQILNKFIRLNLFGNLRQSTIHQASHCISYHLISKDQLIIFKKKQKYSKYQIDFTFSEQIQAFREHFRMTKLDCDALIDNYRFLLMQEQSAMEVTGQDSGIKVRKNCSNEMQEYARLLKLFTQLEVLDDSQQKLINEHLGRVCAEQGIQETTFQQIDNQIKNFTSKIPQDALMKPAFNIRLSQVSKGLANLGNTCYMNSLMQALYYTQSFRQLILDTTLSFKARDLIYSNSKDILVQLTNLMNSMISSHSANMVHEELLPHNFQKSLPDPFQSTYEQQDAGEFARFFLDSLSENMKVRGSEDKSFFQKQSKLESIFFWKMKSVILCYNCDQHVSNSERILDLTVNFKDNAYDKNFQVYKIEEMVRGYFDPEVFEVNDNNNSFYCDGCQKNSDFAIKSSVVEQVPPCIMITVNRFTFDRTNLMRTKLLNQITLKNQFLLKDILPDSCEIESQMDFDTEYILYAFIVHLGKQSESGHYMCYARDIEVSQSKWYLYDDGMRKPINLKKEELIDYHLEQKKFFTNFTNKTTNPFYPYCESPYILFYRNKNSKSIQIKNKLDLQLSIIRKSQIDFTPSGGDTPGGTPSGFNRPSSKYKSGYTPG